MRITRTRVAVLCFISVAALAASGAAVDGYAISGDSVIETPTQTVSYEGQEYTIDSVSRITAGETVTVTTSVPSGAAYYINLRGPNNQLISSEQKTNSTSHTFSYFGSEEAGTYVATIENNGNTVAVHPIVIAGYDIEMSSPDDVEAGQEATISATVTERSGPKHSSLDHVEVVVGNDDVEAQKSMTKVDEDTYETTISTDGLAAETYNVYVVVRGNETVRQRAEILGVSDTAELTVTEATTPTPEPTSDGGGNAGGGGSNTDDQTTETDDQTTTPTPTPTETATPSTPQLTESVTRTADGSDGTPIPTTVGDTLTDSESDNVIAPSTSTTTATSSRSGPGFTISMALLAVLAAIVIGRHR